MQLWRVVILLACLISIHSEAALGGDEPAGGAVSRVQDAGQPVRTKDPPQGAEAQQGKAVEGMPPGSVQEVLECTSRELKAVKDELERQRKQSEIQQKQIETLNGRPACWPSKSRNRLVRPARSRNCNPRPPC